MVTGVIAMLWGCGDPGGRPAPLGYEPIDPVRLLIRASLDLRGVRPSEDDLARVEQDPAALEDLVAAYVRDDRLEGRVREWMASVFLTRTDAVLVDPISFGLDAAGRARIGRDAGEEPLRLFARIVADDRPYEDVVTADTTMVNRTLAEVWPVEAPEDGGWNEVRWTDGRPAAGVLATNGMWWRYDSTEVNANRKRANAVSRILLCDDYLARQVEFDRTAGQLEEGFEERTQSDPACASCHRSLDPLASYLYGFWFHAYGGDDVVTYHPERERLWEDATGVAPAFMDEPGSSLADLGPQLAADGRLPRCMARRMAEPLVGRTLADEPIVADVERALISGGTFRDAIAEVVRSPDYRAATDEGVGGGANPARLADPALLASQVQALTGFSWESGGVELLTSDQLGYLTLAGGVDGYTSTRAAEVPGPTILLVQERLAEAAAAHAVDATLAEPGSVPIVDRLHLSWRPDTHRSAMAEQIAVAQRRTLGRAPADAELDEWLALWSELHDLEGDARMAWVGVVSALLRDPDLLLY